MHYLEISNGEARFAFNKHNGDPWHRLGVAVDGYSSIDEMLVAAQANWEVVKRPLFIESPEGPIEIPERCATVREELVLDADGFTSTLTPLGVVGKNYAIEQNRAAAEWAVDLVGASGGDAVIDTMGVLRNGQEFFVGVDLGTLVLDPEGVKDAVKKYLVVRNGHDGSLALCAYPTNTRVVCWNTATWSYQEARRTKQVHSVRHTRSKDDRKMEAVEAMGLAAKLSELFAEQAIKMMGIEGGRNVVDLAIEAVWEKPDASATDRVRNGWQDRRDAIQRIYGSDTCAAGFGDNGWTAWNAVTEYLDHARPRSTTQKRALASMDVNGDVARAKDMAAQRILQLAAV